MDEEQCFRRHLQRAAQCSVASSNNRFGYLCISSWAFPNGTQFHYKKQLWGPLWNKRSLDSKQVLKKAGWLWVKGVWLDSNMLTVGTWLVLSAWSITLRTDASSVCEWSAAATTWIFGWGDQVGTECWECLNEALVKYHLLHYSQCVEHNHSNFGCQVAFNVRLQFWIPI